MNQEQFENKLLGEFIDDSTKILTDFADGYDLKSVELGKNKDYFEIYEWVCSENINTPVLMKGKTVVCSYRTGFVLIMNNNTEKAESIFKVYELRNTSIPKNKGLVCAVGHETVHLYWFDDGEYYCEHTR